jgi:hypothetical protein
MGSSAFVLHGAAPYVLPYVFAKIAHSGTFRSFELLVYVGKAGIQLIAKDCKNNALRVKIPLLAKPLSIIAADLHAEEG